MASVDQAAVDGGGARRASSPAGLSLGARLGRSVARARASVWAPVVIRALALTAGMLGLAGIGAVSILTGLDGVSVPATPALAANIGSAWLALHADTPAEHETRPAPPRARAAAPRAEPAEQRGDAGAAGAPEAPARSGITKDGKVILNVASVDELTQLPGVGRKRAERIVELRAKLKRFRRASDLLRVRGIGPRGLKRMLPHLVLDPPKEGEDVGS
ncbi:MAG: helix-hairpin-helix domain-containing protein [Polyangiaceae bacterium]|nr:helix-hairpin-helix domain-containing protein [Polyangiaceae bacterium]